MARILVIYNREPTSNWRSTYQSHLRSLESNSPHDFRYLNVALDRMPRYIRSYQPDLVVFHYTFLAVRTREELFDRACSLIAHLADLSCPKALIPHDEQYRPDLLCRVVRDFGVTHVFTPASQPQWSQIYADVDFEAITFTNVLTGYIDEKTVAAYSARGADGHERRIDLGYRSWSIRASHGRHGKLKHDIGRVFASRAQAHDVAADISSRREDAFLGKNWFEFLLACKYTLGVEGGSSILDWDGSYAACSAGMAASSPDTSFEEIEAACFPGVDGTFDYRIIGPRHFEAVITRTCQVLVDGDYSGIFQAGVHYIPVKRDFSDVDEVLEVVREDALRAVMVERAYHDIVESGRWTYKAFADTVLTATLGEHVAAAGSLETVSRAAMNGRAAIYRLEELWWRVIAALELGWAQLARGVTARLLTLWYAAHHRWSLVWLAVQRWWFEGGVGEFWWKLRHLRSRPLRESIRDGLVSVFGEERMWRVTASVRNLMRRLRRLEPVDPGPYVPTAAEVERRERRAGRS